KCLGSMRERRLAQEGCPLLLAAWSLGELRGPGNRLPLQCRLAALKRLGDCRRQTGAIKFEMLGQGPDIVEVLHSAVEFPEENHGLVLLGNDGLSRILAQNRRGLLEKGRVARTRRVGVHHIAEADVDLRRDSRALQASEQGDADSGVLRILLDWASIHAARIE